MLLVGGPCFAVSRLYGIFGVGATATQACVSRLMGLNVVLPSTSRGRSAVCHAASPQVYCLVSEKVSDLD